MREENHLPTESEGLSEHVPEPGYNGRLSAVAAAPTEPGVDEDEHNDDEIEDEDEHDGFVRFRSSAFTVGATLVSIALLALLAANVWQFVQRRQDSKAQIVATVNGAPITQREFNRADASSDQTLDALVAEKLVNQEAKKQKVTVSDSQINDQIATIKKQLGSDQEFRAALSRNHLTENQLRDQIRTQLLAEKMGAKNVSVSDQEAQTFYNQNKAQFGQQTFDQAKQQVKDQLLQQKQSEAIQTWINGLKKSARIDKHLPT